VNIFSGGAGGVLSVLATLLNKIGGTYLKNVTPKKIKPTINITIATY
jgi:hypothetical protein